MIATLADFNCGYRRLKEIFLDSEAMAVAGRIDFNASSTRQHNEVYSAHLVYVDLLSQSAELVMNANKASNLEMKCFVNHWGKSFRLYEHLKHWHQLAIVLAYHRTSERRSRL